MSMAVTPDLEHEQHLVQRAAIRYGVGAGGCWDGSGYEEAKHNHI